MKLNFEYCKKCGTVKTYFLNYNNCFCFYCAHCGYFILKEQKYKPEKFKKEIFFKNIKEKELNDIKQMEVINYSIYFDNCPYKLEHLVEN